MRFILVHGGFHGAWCWERVIPELEALGHEAVAIDLPGHGERVNEQVTLATRRDAVLEVMQKGDVLVGHSGGGYDIALAADAAPDKVGHLIFFASSLPIEGRPLIEASGGRPADEIDQGGKTQLMTDDTGMMEFITVNADGNMVCANFEKTRTFFYHDCDEETARWAFEKLTPAPVGFIQETIHLPRLWNSGIPRSYVQCAQDRSAPAWLSAQTTQRLGVEPIMIDASHSPFLSKPRELAECFVKAAGTHSIGPISPG